MFFNRRGIDTHTKLCLNRPLANGSTTFLDGSGRNHAVTAYGNTKWSNGSQKFGQNAIYFDATGDYLSVADSDDFELGGGKFTIDTWVNLSVSAQQNAMIIAKWDWTTGAGYSFLFWWSGTAYYLIFRWSTDGNATPVLQIAASITINTGEWHHCAVCRNSTTSTKLYFDGVYVAVGTTNYTIHQNPTNITMGSGLNNGSPSWLLNGYLAQPRISKGIARWTGNFTPPKNPYM